MVFIFPHLLTSLRVLFRLRCHLVDEKVYTKMAPQGATLRCKYAKHMSNNSVLTMPLKLFDINILKTLSVCNEM